ncbi:hypothetical protein [Entomohabitans teleogrylli]|uniref:hypothetical protein n=1 Tax=Entomohabitans teleogrylli TaxID=1384589 RepID=UPI00073D281C|nr:hypothetical protein [Entomohabitans teleogrylli]
MLEPFNKEFTCADGTKKTFILSKFPAIAGREIVTQYPITGAPKIGEYKTNEALMLKLMAYVAVDTPNGPTELVTQELVNNHVPDFETLLKIEWAMMEYNCSFFRNGSALRSLDSLKARFLGSITKTLMELLGQLSGKVSPPSGN